MRTDDMTRSARALAAVGVAVLVAACGSTLPPALVSGTGTSADGGLAAPTAAPGVTAGPGSSGPIAVPGGTLPGPGGPTTSPGAVTSVGPTTATVPPGAPAATKVTSPISLGLLYAVNDGAAPAGIDNGNTITPGKVMHALVDDWNHRGGIGGRHINPVYAEMHSYNNNYEQQIAAACAKFTDDNHVVAVLMTLQYYSDQLLSCLGKAHVLLLSGDFAAPDRQDAQRYPLYVTPLTQLGESRESSMVRHLAADGFLSSRSRVGVIVEDCAVDNRIYANGLVPALRSAKVPIASTFKTQCFQSLPDFGAQTSQMSSAVLQFRRQDVDRVMVLSAAAEANIVFAFSEVAENQGYRPGYALTSVAIPIALELNAPAAQMENMRGVGWLPVLDSSVRAQVPPTATGSACLRRLRAQGVPTQTSTDLWTAWSGCDTFFLYDALLRATSGNSDPATLLAALPDVGSSYVAASTVDGQLATSRNRLGPTTGRIFAFDAAKKFHYVSGSFDL